MAILAYSLSELMFLLLRKKICCLLILIAAYFAVDEVIWHSLIMELLPHVSLLLTYKYNEVQERHTISEMVIEN